MAQTVESLIVSLEAKIDKYEKNFNKAAAIANGTFKKVEDRGKKFEATMQKSGASAAARFSSSFRAVLSGVATAAGVGGFQELSDAATRVDNALKVAGLSGAGLESVYQKLFASATANAAPIEDLVTLYSRASQVQKELGASSEDLVAFTNNVALALRVSGKSAQEASGALMQLGQLLGGARVQAEEFNSINDGAPAILQAVAAGIKEAGGSVAKLKQLVNAGEVSNKAFFDGMEAGSAVLQDKAAGSVLTVSQRLTNLNTALIDAARKFNESSQAAQYFGEKIDQVATFVNGIDFDTLIAKLGQVDAAFRNIQQSILGAGASIGEFLGTDQIGKLLTGGAPSKDFLGGLVTVTSTAAIRDRINQAFEGELNNTSKLTADAIRQSVLGRGQPVTTAKTARLPGDSTTTIKPISLADYKVPGSDKASKSSGATNALDSETASMKSNIDAINAEIQARQQLNPLAADFDKKLEAAKQAQDLLTAAQKGGKEVGKELTDVNTLLYGDLSNLTPAAQQQATAIRELALGYADASSKLDTLKASQDAAAQSAKDMIEFEKSAVSGGLSDIRSAFEDGKITAQEWGDIVVSTLNRVADKLQQMIVDSLFDSKSTGLLGSLFGAVTGGIAGGGAGIGGAGAAASATSKMASAPSSMLSRAPTIPVSASAMQAIPLEITSRAYFDDNGKLQSVIEDVSSRSAGKAVKAGISGYRENVLAKDVRRVNGRPRRANLK